jgi:excisionase family DNA binding protein
MSKYMKIKEMADEFGVSACTVLEQIKKGKIRAIRFGSQVLIPRENTFTESIEYKPKARRKAALGSEVRTDLVKN